MSGSSSQSLAIPSPIQVVRNVISVVQPPHRCYRPVQLLLHRHFRRSHLTCSAKLPIWRLVKTLPIQSVDLCTRKVFGPTKELNNSPVLKETIRLIPWYGSTLDWTTTETEH